MNYMVRPGIRKSPHTIQNVVKHCCSALQCDESYISKNSRDRKRVQMRQMVFTILRHEYKHTFGSIGAFFGMDHTTVIHGIRKLADIMDVYPETKAEYIEFVKLVKTAL